MAGGPVLAAMIFRIGFRLGIEVNLTGQAAKPAEPARLHAEIEVSRKRLADSTCSARQQSSASRADLEELGERRLSTY
jgi:hypothetical protein